MDILYFGHLEIYTPMSMKKVLLGKTFALLLFFWSVQNVAYADIRLPSIINNHMVLQQKAEITLWGWADANENIEIKVSWEAKPLNTSANADGKWQVKVKTVQAGGPYTIVFKGKNELAIQDVYLGEVWFCSGQSNMEWRVEKTDGVDSISKAATNPLIRMFIVPRTVAITPQEDVKGTWHVNSPSTVQQFSAVAYHFANEIAAKLNVPVGLVHSSYGGTSAEAWVSKEVLSDPVYLPVYHRQEERIKKYEEAKAKDPSNKKLVDPRTDRGVPSGLYNAMFKPLVNYRVNGILWYQGEANSRRAQEYKTLFPHLIRSWRDEFKDQSLPFYYVQLAPFKTLLPEIREAQLQTLKVVKHVGMAVTADVGNCNDIHPRNKIPVGKRLAYIALNNKYGMKDVEFLSPMYNRYEINKDKIKVFFDTQSDLEVRGDILREFEIAGNDQVFYPAIARAEGKTVVVHSNQVKNPVAVRYAWKGCPDPNLFNTAGLPASPFRTDLWALSK